MPYATITGRLIDSDGVAWKQATWTAVPVSPSSKPVFPDGSPVPTTSGVLDDLGTFSGQIPSTISIRPPGTTLTITIYSLTSAPPVTLTKVQIVPEDTIDLGALLGPKVPPPRMVGAALTYAYDAKEITSPKHGNGYVNTVLNQSYIYMQNSFLPVSAGQTPTFKTVTAGNLIATQPALLTLPASLRISNPGDGAYFDAFGNTPAAESSMRFRVASSDGSLFTPGLYLDKDAFQCFRPANFQGNVLALNGAPTGNSSLLFYTSPTGPNSIDSAGPNPSTMGDIEFRSEGSGGQGLKRVAFISNSSVFTTGSVRADGFGFGSNQTPTYGGLFWDGGGTTFLDGYPNGRVSINEHAPGQTGTVVCYGNFSVSNGTKTFRIIHPLDDTKLLYHACLEGPENGVFYRGEAELVDGTATVELPAYFEALTLEDGRSVLLTQVDDGGELAIVAASRIVDGQFSIRSNVSAALVAWEVKAVRRDLAPLEVERDREEDDNRGKQVNQEGTTQT